MREILFRGKIIGESKWIQGYYVCLNGKSHRIYTGYAETDCGNYFPDSYTVDPETVGQFTGLTDKNDTKIFEGDILQCKEKTRFFAKIPYIVEYVSEIASYVVRASTTQRSLPCMNTGTMKVFTVIGNIHDNPELLKEES